MPEQLNIRTLLEKVNLCTDFINHEGDTVREIANAALSTNTGTQVTTTSKAVGMVASGGDEALLKSLMLMMPGIMDDTVEAALQGFNNDLKSLKTEVSALRDELDSAREEITEIVPDDKTKLNEAGVGKAAEYIQKAETLLVKAEIALRSNNEYKRALIDSAMKWLEKAGNELKLQAPSKILTAIDSLERLKSRNFVVFDAMHHGINKLGTLSINNLRMLAGSVLDATPIIAQVLRNSVTETDDVYKYLVDQVAKASAGVRPGRKIVALGRIQNTRQTLRDVITRYSEYINPSKGNFLKRTRNGALLSAVLVETAKYFDISPDSVNVAVNKAVAKLHQAVWKANLVVNEVVDTAIEYLDDAYSTLNTVTGIINQYGPIITRSMELIGKLVKGDYGSIWEVASMTLTITKAPNIDPRIATLENFARDLDGGEAVNRIKAFFGGPSNDMDNYLKDMSGKSLGGARTLLRRLL